MVLFPPSSIASTSAEVATLVVLLAGCTATSAALVLRVRAQEEESSALQKAGLPGRAALSTFFLDDLLTDSSTARPAVPADRRSSARL